MNKKKLVSLCLVVALAITAAVGGTMAYFTDKTETKANTFTVGNVEITLTEPAWDGTDEGDGQGQKDAPEVYPGEALAKDPQVTNDGENPCFVRVKVTGLNSLNEAGAGDITLRGVSAEWTLHEDGYYYYNGVLAEDDTTPALFTHIIMPTDLKNGDAQTSYSVDVYAEAVQAQGAKASFAAVEKMTVSEIAAWFGTCGMNK